MNNNFFEAAFLLWKTAANVTSEMSTDQDHTRGATVAVEAD